MAVLSANGKTDVRNMKDELTNIRLEVIRSMLSNICARSFGTLDSQNTILNK